jgi:heme exporter protein A
MLKISNLSFGYRHLPLFHDISFEIKKGEMIHLSGSNGAGKSTMMSIVSGLLSPNTGTVEFYPGDHSQQAVQDRRLFLEYLPAEANGLYQKLGAVENLKFWAQLRGRKLSLGEMLESLDQWDLNLPLIRDQFPVEKFSTGMKRKLALARLQLSPAPCWLLDEPFYGLDTKAIEKFRQCLTEHLAGGGMALTISHDIVPLDGLIAKTVSLNARGQ